MPQRSDKRIPTWLTIDLLVIVVSAVIIGIGLYLRTHQKRFSEYPLKPTAEALTGNRTSKLPQRGTASCFSLDCSPGWAVLMRRS